MDKTKQTKQLIANIVNKEYSTANAVLRTIIESKTKEKIQKSLNKKSK